MWQEARYRNIGTIRERKRERVPPSLPTETCITNLYVAIALAGKCNVVRSNKVNMIKF